MTAVNAVIGDVAIISARRAGRRPPGRDDVTDTGATAGASVSYGSTSPGRFGDHAPGQARASRPRMQSASRCRVTLRCRHSPPAVTASSRPRAKRDRLFPFRPGPGRARRNVAQLAHSDRGPVLASRDGRQAGAGRRGPGARGRRPPPRRAQRDGAGQGVVATPRSRAVRARLTQSPQERRADGGEGHGLGRPGIGTQAASQGARWGRGRPTRVAPIPTPTPPMD